MALAVAALGVSGCARTKEGGDAETAASKKCDVARVLEIAGEEDEAKKAYVEVLKKDTTSGCAEEGLSRLDATGTGAERDNLVESVAAWIGALAFAVAVALLAFFLFLMLAYLPRMEARIRRLPLARRALAPRLSFGTIDDKASGEGLAGPLSARLKERLWRMREIALAHPPNTTSTPAGLTKNSRTWSPATVN